METDPRIRATEPPRVTPRQITPRNVAYVVLVLATSSLAFGAWLNVQTFPHQHLSGLQKLMFPTEGLLPGIAVVLFWSSVWAMGFSYDALAKTFAGVLALGLIFLFIDAFRSRPSAVEAARGTQCRNNLKQITFALHSYHDTYGSFPPAYVADETGKPMHSWRVLILPYIDQVNLYNNYNFDEPWNGSINRKIAEYTPGTYACPSTSIGEEHRGKTSYLAVIGPRTVWLGSTSTKISEITDGTDQTVMIVEIPDGNVPWMEPRDISFDDAMKLIADHPAHNTDGEYFNYHLLMADGSVRTMPVEASAAWWKAWLTIAGNDKTPDLPTMPRKSDSDYRPTVRIVAYWSFVVLAFLPLPWVWRRR